MTMMTWVKGVVVTVGLALGGSAMAAGPGPVPVRYDAQSERAFERNRDRDFDREHWDQGWLKERRDRFDRSSFRLFELGKKKIVQGQQLQSRGERLLERARWTRSFGLARKAHGLIEQGEQLEREGRIMVRRARASSIHLGGPVAPSFPSRY